MQTTLNIKNIRSRLDRWELAHLRELAASLNNSLAAAELRAAEAEARAESWMEHAETLRDDLAALAKETGAQIGLAKDGTISILSSDNLPPAPGQYWPAQGGTYLGIAPAEGNLPARHLVAFHADAPKKLNWKDGTAYAESFAEGTRLMTQLEAMLAYTTCKAAFKPGIYWTGTQDSSNGALAQHFESGGSYWGDKNDEFLVVPVRGLSLHDFTPLPAQPVEKKSGLRAGGSMSQRLINWALALSIIAIYAAVQTLDGPSDLQTEATVAADVQDAIQTAQATQEAQ